MKGAFICSLKSLPAIWWRQSRRKVNLILSTPESNASSKLRQAQFKQGLSVDNNRRQRNDTVRTVRKEKKAENLKRRRGGGEDRRRGAALREEGGQAPGAQPFDERQRHVGEALLGIIRRARRR